MKFTCIECNTDYDETEYTQFKSETDDPQKYDKSEKCPKCYMKNQ